VKSGMAVRRWLLGLVLTLLGVVGAVAGQFQEYRLGVGDKLRIEVFGHPELSGEMVVNGAGNIVLPLVNDVSAVGLTTWELGERITGKLKPDYLVNPRVTVELLSYRPYYILGEVERAGSYPYVEGMTVLNAVALAGGFGDRAHRRKMTIERKYGNGRKKIRATPETRVEPGDIIVVKERFF